MFEQAIATGKASVSEKRVICKNGSIVWTTESISSIADAGGKPSRVAMIAFDISERKEIEEAFRTSSERLRLLIESTSDYAIFTTTLDNRLDSWNAGAEKIFGWTEKEAVGQSGAIIFTPEDRAKGEQEKEIKTALRKGRAPDERFHLKKDGTRFYVSGVMNLLRDAEGSARGFVKICRDMTERIEAEKAQHDKEMLQKLVGAQEDERKRIARDLHDELGQKLTALRLKLENVRKICEEEEICGGIDEAQQLAKHIDADVDFLAWELRPAALDDLGLVAATENYVREWSRHSGVTVEFHASGLKRMRLAPEVETNFYRITQEALNNTHKHAKATRASVLIEKGDGSVILIIEDDGKGFNVKDKKSRSKGLGLTGMQERAALVGGTLEIESAPGQGTTIFARVPATIVKRKK
jgi:PAS domain S-box-containing protein